MRTRAHAAVHPRRPRRLRAPAFVLAAGLATTGAATWWWVSTQHHAAATDLSQAADRAARITQHELAHVAQELDQGAQDHPIGTSPLVAVGTVQPVDDRLGRLTQVVQIRPRPERVTKGDAVELRPGVSVQGHNVVLLARAGDGWRLGVIDPDVLLEGGRRAHHRIDLVLWSGDEAGGGRWVAGRTSDRAGERRVVAGTPLVLEVLPRPGFVPAPPGGPWLPAGAGTALTLLAAALAYVRVQLDSRAHRVAAALSVELAEVAQDAWRLAEAAPVGVFRLDERFRLTYANRRVEEILGRCINGTDLTDWVGLVHPEDRDRVATDWAELSVRGREYAAELRLRLPDGRVRWVRVRAAAAHRADGGRAGIVGTLEDLTDVVRANARVGRQSLLDPLTGLANRPQFLRHLDALLAAGEPGTVAAGVVYLDVDDLKVLNDSLGHARGDEVLIEVGRRLRVLLDDGPWVPARFGGDEFAVLCEEVRTEEDVVAAAGLVRSVFDAPFVIDDREVVVTASVGLALAPAGGRSGEVLQDADAAMYRAKDSNRGGWVVFDAAMRAGALERLETVQALWRAVDREEMVLHYQPKVSLLDGTLVGFEALVRWAHPDRGLVPPELFVGLAEETGLIVPLGRWVLEEACRQGAAWAAAGTDGRPLTVAVNISGAQFAAPNLAGDVAAILAETGFPPERLCLEITESVLMDDPEDAVGTLYELKELGVQLAVDDFGTGYSSLGSLRRFPVDQLKIDRTFVAGVGHDADDETIVRLILSLATALGLEVVAEGVETTLHRDRLRAFGCLLGQGFLWGVPVPAAAIGLDGMASAAQASGGV